MEKRLNNPNHGEYISNTGFYVREIQITYVALTLTTLACALAGWQLGGTLLHAITAGEWSAASSLALFSLIVGLLIWGNFVYQFTRLGYLKRQAMHRPTSRHRLEQLYNGEAPKLAILVPSYKEEIDVIRCTLISAALQDYPNRRVALLIDDPVRPTTKADAVSLEATRALPHQLQAAFDSVAAHFSNAQSAFEARQRTNDKDWHAEIEILAKLYEDAAQWLEHQTPQAQSSTGVESLLLDKVLRPLVQSHRVRAGEILSIVGADWSRIAREYNRLSKLFRVEFSSFERKRYENLSHESNKAMNLNSYLSLLGGRFIEVEREGKLFLEPAHNSETTLTVSNAEFVITLDADSILLPDYALKLVNKMSLPGNERVAVIQTPYSSIPAKEGSLEYVAGATTDIQYLIHQGFTAFDATFWVGANALLRVSSLDDIKTNDHERGYPIVRYIQDRTVIEDTESSIDLVERGWKLHNYPERLAYSATPPCFGSLLIQRRRWANGGLIILPKLIRHIMRAPRLEKLIEAYFRLHYLGSIAIVNIGLLLVLAFPFDNRAESLWLPLTALPYFFLYGRDLVQMGYKKRDLARIYALNLLLVPINLGGVFKSIGQAISRKKIPFGRTPKVSGRTASPALYLFAEYGLLATWLIGFVNDIVHSRWAHASFAGLNCAFLAFAIFRYIGWSATVEDIRAGFRLGQTSAALPAEVTPQSPVPAEQSR